MCLFAHSNDTEHIKQMNAIYDLLSVVSAHFIIYHYYDCFTLLLKCCLNTKYFRIPVDLHTHFLHHSTAHQLRLHSTLTPTRFLMTDTNFSNKLIDMFAACKMKFM